MLHEAVKESRDRSLWTIGERLSVRQYPVEGVNSFTIIFPLN